MKKIGTDSIFTQGYWNTAAAEFKNLHTLIFAGLMVALSIVINSFFIPVGENLHISFTFLAFSFGALIFGPVVGLSVGMVYDLLSFILFPSAVFFPGYTLSTMLEFFIYGLFLYHCRITLCRIFFAKFLVNYVIHVGLGSVWSEILFGKGYLYYFVKSIIKNTVMLPIEVILLVALLQFLLPVLKHLGMIPEQCTKRIPLI